MNLNCLSKKKCRPKQIGKLTDLGSTATPDTDAPTILNDTYNNENINIGRSNLYGIKDFNILSRYVVL